MKTYSRLSLAFHHESEQPHDQKFLKPKPSSTTVRICPTPPSIIHKRLKITAIGTWHSVLGGVSPSPRSQNRKPVSGIGAPTTLLGWDGTTLDSWENYDMDPATRHPSDPPQSDYAHSFYDAMVNLDNYYSRLRSFDDSKFILDPKNGH